MKLSLVVPAHNEEPNIGRCLDELSAVLRGKYALDYEVIVVDDDSRDGTSAVVRRRMESDPLVRLVRHAAPGGFGRAVRCGLAEVRGDVVVVYMADCSDDPEDVVAYVRKIEEGYDCVFGSRFIRGSKVEKYPLGKLVLNRIVNRMIKVMFWTDFNDLTNAFKAYRTEVVRECGPYRSCHFNITLEMSLGAVVRRYHIAQVPIRWYGRTWGSSKLRVGEMGRRYLCTLLMLFFQRMLLADDLVAERLAGDRTQFRGMSDLDARLRQLEEKVERLSAAGDRPAATDEHG
jgi:dolichol-phosphate mannosyltransferase